MHLPSSTYRVQLHKDFTFHQLEEILDYLHQLGISTVYASPITTATKGSQHGYDVTDPLRINPEIGTEADLQRLASLLKEKNMSWLQDIVPNHMSFESSNNWLYDVLERGKNSDYAGFFDIDVKHPQELLGTKLMVPFLGKTLTECLQDKELTLEYKFPAANGDSSTGNGFVISYYERDYPVSFSSWQWICTIAEGCPPELLTAIRQLEPAAMGAVSSWTAAKNKWIKQVVATEEWLSFLRQRILFFNQHSSLLAELLDSQHYVLTYAHLAASHINYRRFFTVNSLICLRMEDPTVFAAYHQQIREWYRKGYLQGLRIDHIDGLAFPREYIRALRRLLGDDCYTVAEKIQAADERLPENWQLEGSSGYDFLAIVNQLLTDGPGYRQLTTFYREKIEACPAYEEIVFSAKLHFLQTQMGGEWNNLLDLLLRQSFPGADKMQSLSEADKIQPLPGLDKMDKQALKEALAILMASFPVYRVYPESTDTSDNLSAEKGALPSFSEAERNFIDQAFSRAATRYPAEGSRELDFLKDLFRETGIFQTRLMQFTGPLAAKGVEDTTFYAYNPLISRNEVGDSPVLETMTPAAFHKAMIDRQAHLPYSMNATTTHDTKRGEDARIRLNWLSAIPEEWIAAVEKWQRLNQHAPPATGRIPTANDEYLIYQSLLGSFPEDLVVTDVYRERVHQYLTKALREAKTNTGYDKPNEVYEKGCHDFLTALLEQESAFLEDFIPFVYKIIRESTPYSLSQLLLKLTAPGIPDIYQGAESLDLSLVDPDNRLPVDYTSRKKVLAKLKEEEQKTGSVLPDFIMSDWPQDASKLFTLYKTLAYRNQHPQVFTAGAYIPVAVPGPLLSYLRRHQGDWALVIVPLIRRAQPIPETLSITLPADAPSDWINIFTGQKESGNNASKDRHPSKDGPPSKDGDRVITLELKGLLSKFPVALLVGKSS